MFADRKKLKILLTRVTEVVAEKIEKEGTETGSFPKFTVSFSFPLTKIKGILAVEPDLLKAGDKRLSASAYKEGDDHLVTNYIAKGSSKEMIDWLQDPEHQSMLEEIFLSLMERAKEF